MNASDKETLVTLGKRLAVISVLLYVVLVAGIAVAHLLYPASIGPVDAYVLTTSAIGAVTFGALYAAAMALRPTRPKEPAQAESR